jgi:hypothetical protein
VAKKRDVSEADRNTEATKGEISVTMECASSRAHDSSLKMRLPPSALGIT